MLFFNNFFLKNEFLRFPRLALISAVLCLKQTSTQRGLPGPSKIWHQHPSLGFTFSQVVFPLQLGLLLDCGVFRFPRQEIFNPGGGTRGGDVPSKQHLFFRSLPSSPTPSLLRFPAGQLDLGLGPERAPLPSVSLLVGPRRMNHWQGRGRREGGSPPPATPQRSPIPYCALRPLNAVAQTQGCRGGPTPPGPIPRPPPCCVCCVPHRCRTLPASAVVHDPPDTHRRTSHSPWSVPACQARTGFIFFKIFKAV